MAVAVDADVGGASHGGEAQEQGERVEDSDQGVVYAEHFHDYVCFGKYEKNE